MEAEDKEEEEEDLFGTVYASTAAGLVETDEPGSASTVARSQQSRAWRWRASPSSPRKLSCRQQRGREPNSPTLYQDQADAEAAHGLLLRDFTPTACIKATR